MSTFAVLEEPSFTLPARPGLLAPEPVDLLADPEPRRLPEGTVSGFAVIGSLVAFSCLVGGFTAGLVVIGVSTLLAATAAIVRGQVSLSPVGGQRGAALLLGAAVTALIVPSVTAHERRPAPEVAGGVPVPVSSPFAVSTQTAYAAVPSTPTAGESAGSSTRPSSSSTRPVVPPVALPAVTRPAVAATPSVPVPSATPSALVPGLTLSLDALSPKPDAADPADDKGEKAGHQTDDTSTKGKGSGKAADKAADKSADKAAKKADKAAQKTDKAAQKAAEKAAKTQAKAKAALEKAAEAAAAQARKARSAVEATTTKAVASVPSRALLGSAKNGEKKAGRSLEKKAVKAESKAGSKAGKKVQQKSAKAAKTAKSPAKSGNPAPSGR